MRPPRRKCTQNTRGGYSEDTKIRAPDNGGYLRCARVMVNYTALEEASPAAVPRCACASIAYGVRWRLGYENPNCAHLPPWAPRPACQVDGDHHSG